MFTSMNKILIKKFGEDITLSDDSIVRGIFSGQDTEGALGKTQVVYTPPMIEILTSEDNKFYVNDLLIICGKSYRVAKEPLQDDAGMSTIYLSEPSTETTGTWR